LTLSKEVVASEFPQWQLKSKDGKNVVMTFNQGQNVVISTDDGNGNYKSEAFQFDSIDDKSVWPNSPDFPDYLAKLSLDKFDGVANSDARDDYNNNVKHIENTVNGLVDYSLNQRGFFDKLKDTFTDFKGFVSKIINVQVAQYLHDHVETQYYTKKEIDEQMKSKDQKILNVQRRLPTNNIPIGSYHNPSRTDRMPSNIDVNDQVSQDAEDIIDDWINE